MPNAAELYGHVFLKNLPAQFRTELYGRFTASDVMTPIAATLTMGDPMTEVMEKFETVNASNLPVVDVDGTLKGYISRARTFNMYRKIVADYSAE